jgi:hypothetical protein
MDLRNSHRCDTVGCGPVDDRNLPIRSIVMECPLSTKWTAPMKAPFATHHPRLNARLGHILLLYRFISGVQVRPSVRRTCATSLSPPAKSSNALSVTRMTWSRIKAAPSRAPSSAFFKRHSHSSTAQRSNPMAANREKIALKSTAYHRANGSGRLDQSRARNPNGHPTAGWIELRILHMKGGCALRKCR